MSIPAGTRVRHQVQRWTGIVVEVSADRLNWLVVADADVRPLWHLADVFTVIADHPGTAERLENGNTYDEAGRLVATGPAPAKR
jgi:hypothetical protein